MHRKYGRSYSPLSQPLVCIHLISGCYDPASLNLSDDDSTLQKSLSTAQDLGTISMKVYRIEVDSSRRENVVPSSSNLDNEPVHEKTKKAGSHKVTYVIHCLELLMSETELYYSVWVT